MKLSILTDLIEEAGGLILIVLIAIWAMYAYIHRGEISTYLLFCNGEMQRGICNGKIETSGRSTFKITEDGQSVIQRHGDGSLRRLHNCAVWDVENWHCSENGGLGVYDLQMHDGEFFDSATYNNGETHPSIPQNFYYTSKYKWWAYRLIGR